VVRYEDGAGPASRVGKVCRGVADGRGAEAERGGEDGGVVVELAVELAAGAVEALVPVGAAVGDDVQPASAAHATATVTRRGSSCIVRR